jgi:hypothetical protein
MWDGVYGREIPRTKRQMDDYESPFAVICFANHFHFGNSNGIHKAEAV